MDFDGGGWLSGTKGFCLGIKEPEKDSPYILCFQRFHCRAYLCAGFPRGEGLIIQPHDLAFREQCLMVFAFRPAPALAVDVSCCAFHMPFSAPSSISQEAL